MAPRENSKNSYGLNRSSKEFRSLRAAADLVKQLKENPEYRFIDIRKVTYQDLTEQEMMVFKYLAEIDD